MENTPLYPQNFETETSPNSKSETEKLENLAKAVADKFKPSEKRELFRREEVHTMRKDMQRLLEEQAIKERERLAKLKTEEEIRQEKERIARLKKEEEEKMFAKSTLLEEQRIKLQGERRTKIGLDQITPPTEPKPIKKEWPKPEYKLPLALPQKPPRSSKFMIRALIISILLVFWAIIITFWYWFLFVRTKPPETTPPQVTTPPEQPPQVTTPPEQPPPQQPPQRPELPASILPTETQNIIEFNSPEELPALFENAVRKLGSENTFSRIAFYNIRQNAYLTLSEFLSVFKVNVPSDILTQISGDFTAFTYTSQIANRFGFITQVKDPTLTYQAMLNWESTMEKDTENLFKILGKRKEAANKNFRRAIYKGKIFRYLSFPPINFGLVWSILDITNPNTGQVEYYLIITSSGESMLRVIDMVL